MAASENMITSLWRILKSSSWLPFDFFSNYSLKGNSHPNPSKVAHPAR